MDLKFHPLSVRYFKRVVTGITDELSVNEWVAEGLINCLTEYLTDLSAYWWLIDLLTRTAKPNTCPYNNFQLFFGKKNPALNVWASLLQNLPCKVHFYASLFLCLHIAVRFTSFLCLWFSFHYVACIKNLFANSLKHPSTSPLKHLISQQSMHIAINTL